MKLGIDICYEEKFRKFKRKKVGLLVSSGATTSAIIPTIELFSQYTSLHCIFAPEHGIYGVREYMEEVEEENYEGIRVYSLYGKKKEINEEKIKEIDVLVVDLQDVGVRYYTYFSTLSLCMQKCKKWNKKIIVLDRPNPLGGVIVEGPVQEEGYTSFVGLYPIPIRHGLTIGELALFINFHFNINAEVEVIKMENWERRMWFEDTQLMWIPPSPNMPTPTTAIVYPGTCLLEGTNVSEGRGTPFPFQLVGAPWINGKELKRELEKLQLPGVKFREVKFIPTKDKYQNKLCNGIAIYIMNKESFSPILFALLLISKLRTLYPSNFKWRPPPYEFEENKLPFDILIGNSYVRKIIEKGEEGEIFSLEKRWEKEVKKFKQRREKYLLY